MIRILSRYLLIIATVSGLPLNSQATTEMSYKQGQQWLQQRLDQRQRQTEEKADNLILFVGDGMSVTTLTAARIMEGQRQGNNGEENTLSFESFPHTALVKTYNTNQQTADSAGTMSAITTGVKTRAGVIAIGPEQDRAICQGWEKYQHQTLLQWAAQHGYATGVVTNARITHATPAATYAHSPERDWESDGDLTAEAKQFGCQDIASQLIHKAYPQGLDIALGGGKANFQPASWYTNLLLNKLEIPYYWLPDWLISGGQRQDTDLIEVWQQQFPNGQYLEDTQQLHQLNIQESGPVLGLFANYHMAYHQDAPESQPSLELMTDVAVRYLKNKVSREQLNGYILIVEGARIDHGHHLGNAYRALDETIELAKAVQGAKDLSDKNTLLLVTADHSHTLSMAGYPQRGNPILGFTANNGLALAKDNQPYTTLGYSNGEGGSTSVDHQHRHIGRIPWHDEQHKQINPQDPDFYQAGLAESYYETHGSDDVALHALGPGAQLFHGLIEQNTIYHLIRRALAPNNTHAEQSLFVEQK